MRKTEWKGEAPGRKEDESRQRHRYNQPDMRAPRKPSLLLCALLAAASSHAQAPAGEAARLQQAGAAFRAGHAAFLRNDLPTAHSEFAKAVRLAPKIAPAHSALGAVLLAEGNPAAAVPELRTALTLDPGHADEGTVLNFAAALAATGDTPTAQQQIELALRKTPNSAPLHDALGTLLAQQNRLDQAAAEFQRAITLDSTLAAAHFHLGSVFLHQRNPTAAVAELAQAHTLAAEDPAYALQLGRALSAANRDQEAIATLRSAVTLDPSSLDAKYELALALQASGDPKSALPLFEQVTLARPQNDAALTNHALALVQTGDAQTAIPLYLRALKINASSPTLREDLGVAYLQQSDLDHAIEQFRAGLTLEPGNPQLHYDVALAFKLKDDVAAAIPEFEEAARLDPQLPDPPYTLGVLYMQLGRFPESREQLERATTLRPGNGDAWAILGNVYKQTDQPDQASAALRKAIALLPDQPSPHITLAAILAQQGDTAAAARERKIAADLSRIAVSRQRASFALDSGRLLLKRGQIPEAIEQLQTAIAAAPDSPDPHLALAEALDRQGHSAEAAAERLIARQKAEQPPPAAPRP
jgi:protein O-GlcNAc transferase